jgi:hypothetical protein
MTSSSAPPAQMGAVADLEVAQVVACGVLHHLIGHPLQRLGRLQQRDRDVEPLEIILEVFRIVDQHEPAELIGIGGGQVELCRPSQIDHRLRPERAVQVHVELRLGQALNQLTRQHCCPAAPGQSPVEWLH